MKLIKDPLAGIFAHTKGMKYAFGNKGYLPLLFIPFALTVILYVVGFYVFTVYSDAMLAYFWHVAPDQASGATGVVYWLYVNVLKYIVYLVVLALMYFLFMVLTNIFASPIYDIISHKIATQYAQEHNLPAPAPVEISIPRIVMEEIKKAGFVLLIPLVLMFIPVIGAALSLLFAMALIAWDFVDFSLARDKPVFRDRLKYVMSHKLMLLGFGCLMLVPVLNFVLFPFAIMGASLLYQEQD